MDWLVSANNHDRRATCWRIIFAFPPQKWQRTGGIKAFFSVKVGSLASDLRSESNKHQFFCLFRSEPVINKAV